MPDKIKVIITDAQKDVKIPTGIKMLLRRCCHAVLVSEEFKGSAEVNIRFVNDEEIHRLNLKFRNIDRSTDVLSFPLGENGVYDVDPETGLQMLGDIVISVQHAEAQAREYGHSFQREMAFLTAHSMLHLLGYDHVNGGLQAVRMREKEEKVLAQLGLAVGSSYYMNDDNK
ncbi:MAG: rRNA maturation RNase YbeY [Clostridia bacterium]|nr:rRNA maturation RNase YbeY [Clostridia bacterium]MBQ9879415.1 rRNA maturation RNase YbeY [Clostridia bacterium]